MDSIVKWTPSYIKSTSKLATQVQRVQSDVPLNKDNLPLAYVDPTELARLSATDDPSLAMVPLSYMEGFPTVNGVPFWERLENEDMEQYELFKAYRNLAATEGRRSIAKIAKRANASPVAVAAVAGLWHWTARVRAYDLYKEAEREAIRAYEVKKMENKHSKAADRIFETCMEFIDKHKGELTPKSALDWLKTAVELKRLSMGLYKDKPDDASEHGGGRGPTIHISQNISSGPNGSLSTAEQDKSHMMEILAVLKQTGALDPSIIDIEGEVTKSESESRGPSEVEACNDSTNDEVHSGDTNTEASGISSP